MVGIKRLAQHLHMSISTVSRALNEKPDSSQETRRRVREAAKKLGYVANQSGRSLRSGTTGSIGFMMQTSYGSTGPEDSFFITVFDGVQRVLNRHNLDLVALLCSSKEDPDEYLRRMVSRGFVDGIILSHTRRVDPRIEFLADRGLPFVTLGRSLTDVGQPWLDIDFETIARRAIERFVSQGHQRIAITLPDDDINFGYVFRKSAEAALAAHGLQLDRSYVYRSTHNERGGYFLARRLLATPVRPTAIALVNERVTTGLYRGLQEADYLPGRDISVIGRDSPYAQFLSPKLTNFRQPLVAMGTALGEALLAVMPQFAEVYPTGVVRKVLPTRLVLGESDAFVRSATKG